MLTPPVAKWRPIELTWASNVHYSGGINSGGLGENSGWFMPVEVIDLRVAEDWRDVVHRAVQSLAEGKLVVFPTETVYGLAASALDESAVERLI